MKSPCHKIGDVVNILQRHLDYRRGENDMEDKKFLTVQDMTFIALFTALIAVCSWISLSFGQITFSLQTFAVFVTAGLLGTKRSTLSVIIYILLGVVGVPVFAGFSGGLSAVAGYLGGFIVGFIPAVIIIALAIEKIKFNNQFANMVVAFIAMFIGDAVCFLCGGIWFKHVLALDWKTTFALSMAPYIVPDIVKMIVAVIIVNRLRKYVSKILY
jgi:biotin transport system substrate-specific component